VSNYVRDKVASGLPILFWVDRYEPFIIGGETTASSGKVATWNMSLSSSAGSPMTVAFRMAKRAHVLAWIALVNNNPFNTTSLASYFSTGHTVIFARNKPIVYENEIIKEYDMGQDIFNSAHADYRAGFDCWKGVLNLRIVT
jgi:hypothetical protein